jgi:ribonuclease G
MTTQLIISVSEWDTRVAVVEEGRLAEFYLERRREHDPSGNIYKGRVARVLPGMAAAFIDVGLERPGYLYVDEVVEPWEDFYNFWLKNDTGAEGSQPRRQPPTPIEDLLHEGQEILVQVYRPPLGNKGARLTTNLSLAGH